MQGSRGKEGGSREYLGWDGDCGKVIVCKEERNIVCEQFSVPHGEESCCLDASENFGVYGSSVRKGDVCEDGACVTCGGLSVGHWIGSGSRIDCRV